MLKQIKSALVFTQSIIPWKEKNTQEIESCVFNLFEKGGTQKFTCQNCAR